jgi:AcrR family transcriptional regulator
LRPEKVEEKRALIVDAALSAFGERGYHATNIADIAKKLGMGHGTFYRYFENKLDIFKHVITHVVARVAEAVALDDPSEAKDLAAYRRQVERIGERLTAVFLEEEHAARILFVEAVGIEPEITAQLDAAFELFAGTTEAYLVNGQRRGFLRKDVDTATTARAINAMIFESVKRAYGSHDAKKTAKRWMKVVVALMFEGLGA